MPFDTNAVDTGSEMARFSFHIGTDPESNYKHLLIDQVWKLVCKYWDDHIKIKTK